MSNAMKLVALSTNDHQVSYRDAAVHDLPEPLGRTSPGLLASLNVRHARIGESDSGDAL